MPHLAPLPWLLNTAILWIVVPFMILLARPNGRAEPQASRQNLQPNLMKSMRPSWFWN